MLCSVVLCSVYNTTGPILRQLLTYQTNCCPILGSERDFVIISTVRSLPESEVLVGPSQQWMALHLGFLIDEHQINVAITRARHGLFIVGEHFMSAFLLMSIRSMWPLHVPDMASS